MAKIKNGGMGEKKKKQGADRKKIPILLFKQIIIYMFLVVLNIESFM